MYKSIIIYLFALCVVVSAFSQTNTQQKLTIEIQDKYIHEALLQVEAETNWKFSFNPQALPKRKINKTYEHESIGHILNDLLGEGYEYKIRGSYLIIQNRRPKQTKSEEQLNISGKIVDAKTGEELENASVYEVNTLTASLSKPDGSYQIEVPNVERITWLAITKENYQDTLVRLKDLVDSNLNLQLRQINDADDQKSKAEKKMNRFLKNKDARQHNSNITLKEERLMQLSLVPVVSTNGMIGGQIANKYSLNLIAGYAHSLNGLEISGALNMEKQDVKGVQIAGASNIVGERMTGVQIAGASNTNFTLAKGVIIGGAMNSSGAVKGTQIAGAYNYVKHKMEGVQVSGGFNYAGELRGVQIGVVNIARKIDKGFMFGIVNISEDGFARFELDHNDVTDYNITFKSGRYSFYSIFTAGITPKGNNQLWSYGMGFGSQWYLAENPFIAIEATSHTIQPLERHISGLTIDNRLGVTFGYQIVKHLSIEGGPLLHYYLFANKKERNQSFYEQIGGKPFAEGAKQKAWVGYRLAIRF
ncbi:MAG: hypothetical protein ABJN36_18885 [Cyclobacteriaceae bacterium]